MRYKFMLIYLEHLPIIIYSFRLYSSKNIANETTVAKVDEESYDVNEPVKFSSSRAAVWRSNYKNLEPEVDHDTRRNNTISRIIYSSSAIIFYLYLILREGNDLDDEMAMPLGKRILALHQHQLLEEKERLLKNYENTEEVDSELMRIANLKKQYNYNN